jgi:hypothetical protein
MNFRKFYCCFLVIEKPRVVYSSAPIINKPEKKKKKKKDNAEEGGGGIKTGDHGKAGPPGDGVPSGSFVPLPEMMMHEQTHVSNFLAQIKISRNGAVFSIVHHWNLKITQDAKQCTTLCV